jgi:trk system potassium uptake protein TrkA
MGKKKVLVIGLGRFGSSIVEALWKAAGIETIALDSSAAAVDAVKERADASFVGSGVDPKVLEGIGAAECDVAVVTFGEDFEATVLSVAELKRLGVKEIVARAANRRQVGVLRAVGATRVYELEQEMGRRVSVDLVTPIASDLLEFAHQHQIHPWIAGGRVVGQTLADAQLRKNWGVTVLGYRRAGSPERGATHGFEVAGPDYKIAAGDVLLLVGATSAMQKFVTEMGG